MFIFVKFDTSRFERMILKPLIELDIHSKKRPMLSAVKGFKGLFKMPQLLMVGC